MKPHTTRIKLLAGSVAVIALALAAGPSGIAKSWNPELGDANRPAKQPAPKPRASFQLVKVGQGACGPETYAVVVGGQRRTLLC
jgi:hypothetical protein